MSQGAVAWLQTLNVEHCDEKKVKAASSGETAKLRRGPECFPTPHAMSSPVTLGEPLKGNFRGIYSCSVKRNFLNIFLYCAACRKKGDDAIAVLSTGSGDE